MSKKYLAYGSNMNLGQMSHRCPTAKPIRGLYLKDYHLVFRGPKGGAVATIEPKPGSSVPCLLWELQEEDEWSLDRYEGYPYFYRKEYLDIELNGEPIKAMVYIMNEGRPLNEPGFNYYNTILEGYENAGFDSETLEIALEYSRERL